MSLTAVLLLRVTTPAALFLTQLLVPHAASLSHLLLAVQLCLASHVRGAVTGLARSLCQVVMGENALFSSSLMPQSLP